MGVTEVGRVMLSILGGIHASVSPGVMGIEGCLGMLNSAPCFSQPVLSPPQHDKIELLGQGSRRAGPCPSAPGTTGPLELRSASSQSHLLQVHLPHPPLQARRTDAATRQPGRTGARRLNPYAPAPQLARK